MLNPKFRLHAADKIKGFMLQIKLKGSQCRQIHPKSNGYPFLITLYLRDRSDYLIFQGFPQSADRPAYSVVRGPKKKLYPYQSTAFALRCLKSGGPAPPGQILPQILTCSAHLKV